MARSNGKVKSPSKFISLAKLEDLQLNNCIGDTGQEYCADEIQDLIYLKRSQLDERQQLEPYEREEQPENTEMKHQAQELQLNTTTLITYKAYVKADTAPTSPTVTIETTCQVDLIAEIQAYLDLGYQVGKIFKESRTIVNSVSTKVEA